MALIRLLAPVCMLALLAASGCGASTSTIDVTTPPTVVGPPPPRPVVTQATTTGSPEIAGGAPAAGDGEAGTEPPGDAEPKQLRERERKAVHELHHREAEVRKARAEAQRHERERRSRGG